MLSTTPFFCFSITSPKTCAQSIAPVRPTAISWFHISTGKLVKRIAPRFLEPPSTLGLLAALLISTSIWPYFSRSVSLTSQSFSREVISVMMHSYFISSPYSSFNMSTFLSMPPPTMSSSTGMPPPSTTASACLSPISPPPPVMMHTRSVISIRCKYFVFIVLSPILCD